MSKNASLANLIASIRPADGLGFVPLVLLALSACPADPPAAGTCSSDAECPLAGTRCDLAQSSCICVLDEACPEGQFCNQAGVCQARAGCIRTSECAPGTFCDIVSGRCLEGPAWELESACGVASHCPYGTICDPSTGRCESGCFDDGDCVLGQVCLDGFCSTGDGLCSSDDFCDYRQRCETGACKRDRRGPYCRGCSQRTTFNPEPCDHPRNFCLINSEEAGGFDQWCGVDCSLGQPCPNGYDCSGVVILTQRPCTFTAECRCELGSIRLATRTCTVSTPCDPRNSDGTVDPNASACTFEGHADCGGGAATCIVAKTSTTGSCTCDSDDDCDNGAACVAGACCTGRVRQDRDCAVGESRVSGFCTCATDEDCPRDTCDATRGACAITGLPCTPGNDDCGPIPCVDGGCVIGANCGPLEGLACSVVGGGE